MVHTKNRIIKKDYQYSHNKITDIRKKNETSALVDQVPVYWTKAKDFSIFDGDGNKWIDMTSGIFATNSGHANEEIKRAIQKQLDEDLLFAYQYDHAVRNEIQYYCHMSHFNMRILLSYKKLASDMNF